MTAAVVAEGLRKVFEPAGRVALDDVSLVIRPGCITGLAGPDAAGKTTFMRIMAGLLKPSAGRVSVLGLDPLRQAGALRARLGYMPQRFGLYEDLTVAENLSLYADLRGVAGERRRAQFERLLAFTGLHRFTGRRAGKLSGGMKQKLGLACTLLGRPELLLLDEPGVGVDPVSRRELWRMVSELASEGMTVVWATAYLDEAEQCEEVCLMNEGRVLHAGKPQSLMEGLAGRALLLRGHAGNPRRLLRAALSHPAFLDGVLQGRSVRLVLREGARPPAPGTLDAGPDARLEPVRPRLEDAFMDMLGGGPGGASGVAERWRETPLPEGVASDAVIEARGLTRRFGDFVAADHIGFRVGRGEIYGLLGPNGAGKSTTFKMMCGLLAPSGGEARVMGIDLRRHASRARQRIGYMAQKFSLYGDLSVVQNLAFFAGVYGLRGAAARRKLEEMETSFELAPYRDTSARELSLGYKQRLALACALMHEPPLLFLDEPTSGVDPITRREFWNHINGLVDKGVTVMVTTHFMDEAEYCDRVALIHGGRMIAEGRPDELKAAVADAARPDPTMEDAFVGLIESHEAGEARRSAAGEGASSGEGAS